MLSKISNLLLRKHWRQITINPLPTINEEDRQLIKRILKENKDYQGTKIKEFEQTFAKYLGVKYTVSFGKLRIGLYAILKSMNLKKQDEVLIPTPTCVVVSNTVIFTGAKPIYIDTEKDSLHPSLNNLKRKISSKTKAIIIPYLFGEAYNIESILKIAKQHNIVVIEDAAQSLGAEYKKQKIGTSADFGVFSFDYSKNITTGQGGIVTTNNKQYYEQLLRFREQCSAPRKQYLQEIFNVILQSKLLEPSGYCFGAPLYTLFNKLGLYSKRFRIHESINNDEMHAQKPNDFLKKFSDQQAILGLGQLKKLEDYNKRRIEIAELYNKHFKKLGLKIPQKEKDAKHVYLRYILEINKNHNKNEVIALFAKNQVTLGTWFNYPLFPQSKNLSTLQYQKGTCSNTEEKAKYIINLPCHPKMSDDDVQRVISLVAKYKYLFRRKS